MALGGAQLVVENTVLKGDALLAAAAAVIAKPAMPQPRNSNNPTSSRLCGRCSNLFLPVEPPQQ